jgi:predicted permease
VAVSAVLSSVAVPLINMLAVVALTIFIKGEGVSKISPRRILVNIVKNPLIRGVALGLLCLVIRMVQVKLFGRVVFALNRQLKFVYEALNSLKALTTPLALLVLGGQFTFSAAKSLRKEIIVSVFWRLVLAPLIGIGGAYLADRLGWIHCGAAEYPALIALFASPIAVSSAIMAKEMKNDEQLGSQLVVWTCLCSAVTLFVIVCLLMTFGLIPA